MIPFRCDDHLLIGRTQRIQAVHICDYYFNIKDKNVWPDEETPKITKFEETPSTAGSVSVKSGEVLSLPV